MVLWLTSFVIKSGLSRWSRSEAEGYSGGVWVLWKEEEVRIGIRYDHKFFIHVSVASNNGKEWELIVIYLSPVASKRKEFWGTLDEMVIEKPWVLVSDYNCVLMDEERSLVRGVSSSFIDWVERRGLVDLGYT